MLGNHRYFVGNSLLCGTNKRLLWCCPCLHPLIYRRNIQHNPLYLIYPVRSNRYPHRILCTTFRLCRLGIDRWDKPSSGLSNCHRCLNHTHCTSPHLHPSLFSPSHIVGIASRQCHLLLLQIPMGNFCNHHRTSPHHTLGICCYHRRTTIPWDNRCNCCFFLCRRNTYFSRKVHM